MKALGRIAREVGGSKVKRDIEEEVVEEDGEGEEDGRDGGVKEEKKEEVEIEGGGRGTLFLRRLWRYWGREKLRRERGGSGLWV